MDIELEHGFIATSEAVATWIPRPHEPTERRRASPGSASPARIWYSFGNRLNVRIENLGGGATITGIRLSPLPTGALVDWNKALPAAVAFEGAGLAIRAATRRAILDTLASVRIALPQSTAEHPELVLEIGLRFNRVETTAVTTVALSDSLRSPGQTV